MISQVSLFKKFCICNQISMEKIVFTTVLLITLQETALSFSNSMTYNHTTNLYDMGVSYDGKTIILKDDNYLLLYLTIDKNGLRYVTQNQVDIIKIPIARYFYLPREAKQFIIGGNNQFMKIQIGDFKVKEKWEIDLATINRFVIFGNTGLILYKSLGKNIWLYENELGQPTTKQQNNFDLQQGNRIISNDGTYLATSCPTCSPIQIHKLQTSPQLKLVFVQQITPPSKISDEVFSFEEYNRFFAYSHEEKLYIYKRNTTDGIFKIHQQIVLPYNAKKVQFAGSDIWIFCTAVDKILSIKLQMASQTSEMFQIVSEKQISSSSYKKIQIRENYTLLSTGNQLTVLYDCPENCANCNALRECHKCQEGYNLEKDRCRLSDRCLVYQDDKFKVCQQYCSKKCVSCQDSMDNCIQCKQSLYNKEECSLKEKTLIIGIALIILTTVRLPRHRMLCMMIGNFQLYLYHKSSYDGIFREVLNLLSALNALSQSLILTDILKQLIQSIKVFTNFNAFANQKYLQTEGMNGNFVTNFIILSLPAVILKIITFFLLNWIFYRLFDKRISKFLRIYSFKLYLVEMILIGELPNMVFLFVYNSNMLFRISSSKELLLHFISVLAFGLLLITIFVLFFFYRRNYGKLEKYFYTNCVPKRGALQYLWNKYVLKAAIYGVIHSLLFEHPSVQLLSLALLEVISLLLTLITAAKYKIFVCQIKLCVDFLTEFILSILNFFLYCKQFYSIGNQDLTNLMEMGIKMCIQGLLGLVMLYLASDFIEFIGQCKKLILSKDQKDETENHENTGEQSGEIQLKQIIKINP